MSQPKEKPILTITLQPSAELKELFADAKADMQQTQVAIELWQRQAERETAKSRATGGLLAVMAANDAQPELKELGQWVFEGQPDHIKSAAVNMDGRAVYYRYKKSELVQGTMGPYFIDNCCDFNQIDGVFDANDWQNSAINREPVNDVDYLSGADDSLYSALRKASSNVEHWPKWKQNSLRSSLDDSVPHIDDVLALPNWLSGYAGLQITQADMQLIFIKNLSSTLIQRMHSMNRFSEDDYAIGGDKLMAWDIVIGRNSFNDKRPNFAIVIATSNIEHSDKSSFGIADLTSRFSLNQFIHTGQYVKISVWHNETYRTITEDELPAFREALEACYA